MDYPPFYKSCLLVFDHLREAFDAFLDLGRVAMLKLARM